MLKFQDPSYLWLLWLLPLLAALRYIFLWARHRKMKRLGDLQLLARLMPDVSKTRPALKFWILMSALALLVVMLARPQMGTKVAADKRNGIEAIIAIDISNSMLAQDVVPSRLDKVKLLVENLVDNFTDDKVGLVVFAGDAFVQLPITNDFVSAKMFLQGITPALISTQGTDLAKAVTLASKSFTQQQGIGRAIIVITDGEDHEGGAEEAVKQARSKGINVFVLGIGNTKGAPIPVGNGEYLKDASGNVVMSALNEDMCRSVAEAGKGMYIHVDNTNDAQEQLNAQLAKLQKGESQNVVYSEYAEQFQAFGIIVLILLVVEACLLERKNSRFAMGFLFRKKR